MKLGLIQALNPEKTGIFDYEYPPLGLLYIAGYLRKHIDIEIILKQDAVELIDEKPDIIGISANSINFKEAIKISQEIKRHSPVPVIAGGPHITILPYSLPASIDIGVIGEGEETLKELIELYLKEKKFTPQKLSGIKGIVYKENGVKEITQPRPHINPLDLIPPPDRTIYEADFTPCIITSRGCPYKCRFCSLSSCWKKFRRFSTDYIKKELTLLIETIEGYPHIRILDDVFALDIKRVREIKDFIVEKSFHKKVSFDCSIRAETFTEEMCKTLKDMNITRVFLGAESGSEKILKYYRKNQSTDDNQRVVDLCSEYDLELTASFIIGAPPETAEDIRRTYKFIEKNKDKFWQVHVNILDPLPGTEIWIYAKEKGLVSEKDVEIKSINLCEHLEDVELLGYLRVFEELICNEVEKRFQISQELMADFYG